MDFGVPRLHKWKLKFGTKGLAKVTLVLQERHELQSLIIVWFLVLFLHIWWPRSKMKSSIMGTEYLRSFPQNNIRKLHTLVLETPTYQHHAEKE